MSLTPLDLTSRLRETVYYDRTRDMETAVVWSAIKKTLTGVERGELFGYIKSVRLTDTSIMITTTKPLANAEISIYRELLMEHINESLTSISAARRERLVMK